MRDISFGQYYPANSVFHRLDPRIKIVLTTIYIVSIFFIRTYAGYLFAFLVFFVAATLSTIPFRLILKSIRPMLFIIMFTLILNLFFGEGKSEPITINLYFYEITFNNFIWRFWRFQLYWTNIDFAIKMALRLIMLVFCPSLLTLTTTPTALTDGIESLLKPLRVVRFPVHEFALIMSIALGQIPTIMQEADKIILAQKARCADFDSKNVFKKAKSLLPVLIPLFVSSIKRADALSDAMDSRCYNGSKGRTKLKKLTLKVRDFVALFVVAAYFFGLLVLAYNFWNFGFITMLY